MSSPPLLRRLGLGDAVLIGLGSMIGAGVFVVFAPAAEQAGAGLVVGLAIAAFIAFCNAIASAQLAAAHPESGGSYLYGRRELGPVWGFIAGWGFVVGKIASCAVMALTFAAYAAPEPWQRPVAVLAVIGLVTVNLLGVTRTALATRIIVVITLVALAVTVVVGWTGAPASPTATIELAELSGYAILQAAGMLFFAFAGYARIATMGEEVRDPSRTIPRAIGIALGITVVIYLTVGVTLLVVLGAPAVADSRAPLSDLVAASGWPLAEAVVRIGAATASLGALLALIAGIGRTALAMARDGELPRWLAAVHPRYRVPHHAELAIGLIVVLLVLSVDLRGAIGFSSFGVLVYYAIANAAALRQTGASRRAPRVLQVLGLAGCVVLVVTLPLPAILIGVIVFGVGLGARGLLSRGRGAQS